MTRSDLAGAFDGRLSFGNRPALLLVDVVMAYLEPGSLLYDKAFVGAFAANERLVAAARDAGVAVLFTNVVYQPGGADGGLFYRKVPALKLFDRGSPAGAFPPSLQPRDDETVVTKQYASAFFGTSLASTLTAASIDTLIITGFSTSGCVRPRWTRFSMVFALSSCARRAPIARPARMTPICSISRPNMPRSSVKPKRSR